jgi:hypothetical protein
MLETAGETMTRTILSTCQINVTFTKISDYGDNECWRI